MGSQKLFKLGRHLLAAAGVLALSISGMSAASAVVMTEYSGDGGDLLVTAGAVTVITPHSAWGDVSDNAGLAANTADWISYANTGIGGIVAPNAATRTRGAATAHFQRTFSIGGSGDFDLWILADDTAIVDLTGPGGIQTLFTPVLTQVDPCAPGNNANPIGCTEVSMGMSSLSGLASGLYTLDVYALQTNASVFGTQYAFTYTTAVPEPASIALLGLGLAGFGFGARRRRT